VRLVLVTPPRGTRAGEVAAGLAEGLLEAFEVTVCEAREPSWRDHDQILHVVADEAECGFVAPIARRLGGTVLLLDWDLGRLALAAYPELAGPGIRGRLRAWREGPARNRGIVRFADAFLVPDERMRAAILRERNAPTPVGVVGLPVHASACIGFLERSPHPRCRRVSLLKALSDARRPPG